MALAWSLRVGFAISFINITAASDGGDDFSNNLFSDLAPLLALFGEQVAKQFMSQSMGWADNFIFAMAPLGILTAIVGAIRVGGPTWLKAIIGRARENRAVAEQELMSSTSDEVCELWNDQQVVRITGSAPIRELICLVPCEDSQTEPHNPETKQSGDSTPKLWTLEEAEKQEYLEIYEPSILQEWRGAIPALTTPWKRPGKLITSGKDIEANREFNSTIPKSQVPEVMIVQPECSSAPNLSLNLHNRSGRGELRVVAIFGAVLRLGVLMYSGFATYYPRLKFQKGGLRVGSYAFPLTAAGTLILVVGMLICSHVVESNTTEKIYRVKRGMKARILWLQKSQTVSDQSFDSFAIFAKDARSFITTSRRTDKQSEATKTKQGNDATSTFSEILATIGTIISLCGFIIQFVGLRGMHWSATIMQLGATLVMTIMRAWVRRGLAKRPQTQRLTPEYELDWLATRVRKLKDIPWPDSFQGRRRPSEKPEPGNFWSEKCWEQYLGREAMKIRAGLGKLTGWHGPAFDKAICVAKSIEAVLNTLSPSLRGEVNWSFEVPISQIINFKTGSKNGKWEVDVDEIEAALSLCLFASLEEEHPQQKLTRCRRLLGPYTQSLHRDLRWWMVGNTITIMAAEKVSHKATGNDGNTIGAISDGAAGSESGKEIDRVQTPDATESKATSHPSASPLSAPRGQAPKQSDIHNHPSSLKVKFVELPEHYDYISADRQNYSTSLKRVEANISELEDIYAIVSDNSWSSLYAQDMFSAFMKAVGRALKEPIGGRVDVRHAGSATAWQSFTLHSSTLFKIAQDVQRTGLGSLEEAYLNIIPSLSMEHKLPKPDTVVGLARQQAERHELLGRWQEAGEVYLWLFRTCITFGAQDDVAIKATAVLMEFLRSLDLAIDKRIRQLYEEAAINQLKTVRSSIIKELKEADDRILSGLAKIFTKQGRIWNIGEIKATLKIDTDPCDKEVAIVEQLGHSRLHKVAADRYVHITERENAIKESADLNAKDALCWTPLHYALATGQDQMTEMLLKAGADVNAKDLSGWTPLHYACTRDNNSIWNLLQYITEVGVQGRDRVSPLHCAAMKGYLEVAVSLVEAGADVNVLDAFRNTPLHYAAYHGRYKVTEFLYQEANKTIRDHNGRTPLHLAALGGDEAVARLLLEKGAALESQDKLGQTPLSLAALGGREAVVKLLLENNAMREAQDKYYKRTPLCWAALGGRRAEVKLLLDNGAALESQDKNEQTPLSLAAEHGHEAVVKLLLEEGAALESQDKFYKRTPLSLAALRGHEGLVRLLLEKGAAPEAQDKFHGRTPLSLAANSGHEAVVKLLLKNGAVLESQDKLGRTPLSLAADGGHEAVVKLLIGKGAALESQDKDEQTPLSLAAERGHEAVVKLLLEEGAALESQDKNKQTPLSWAALRGHEAVVKLLLEEGAALESQDENKQTPLSLAAECGHEAVVKLLLGRGAALESQDKDEQTPLSLAAERGREAVVKLLIGKGAALESQDKDEQTPLSLAAERGHEAVVKLLLEEGAALESQDKNKQTPLSLAALGGREAVVKLLLERGAALESQDKNKQTPLSLAAKRGLEAVVKLLLEKGAALESQDENEQTPLSLAAERGRKAVVKLLLEKGAALESQDKYEQTPLSLAEDSGHEAVVKLLLEKGAKRAHFDRQVSEEVDSFIL